MPAETAAVNGDMAKNFPQQKNPRKKKKKIICVFFGVGFNAFFFLLPGFVENQWGRLRGWAAGERGGGGGGGG
eukprot:COSAG06_NODE_57878_length_279_cov_0.550000_1_plen_72_part_10